MENFRTDGIYKHFEIMFSECGKKAKVRDTKIIDGEHTSDWLDIEMVDALFENDLVPVIDSDGYNIYVNDIGLII